MTIITEDLDLTKFFLAVVLLLFSAHFFGFLFNNARMPKVIGEILGGLVIGPTLFGFFFPEIFDLIFVQESQSLAIIYWFGLIFLMFCSGFEVDPGGIKKEKKIIGFIALTSTIFPFALGWLAMSYIDMDSLIGTAGNETALKLVVAIAIAVTSIPVVSKIFLDLNIIKTRFAAVVLGTATVHDIVLWIFLAIATSLVSSSVLSVYSLSLHVIFTLAFFAIVLFLTPKIIHFFDKNYIYPFPKNYELGFIIGLLLIFVVFASFLNINVVFGAFLAGIVVGFVKTKKFKHASQSVKEVAFAFFIPVYFAIVGAKLDLIHNFDILFFLGFFLFATLAQGITVLLTTKSLGYTWLSSVNVAVAMNARGGPGIVLATVAFDAGIINESFFVSLVMLAIVTSLLAGTWLQYVTKEKWPLLE